MCSSDLVYENAVLHGGRQAVWKVPGVRLIVRWAVLVVAAILAFGATAHAQRGGVAATGGTITGIELVVAGVTTISITGAAIAATRRSGCENVCPFRRPASIIRRHRSNTSSVTANTRPAKRGLNVRSSQ